MTLAVIVFLTVYVTLGLRAHLGTAARVKYHNETHLNKVTTYGVSQILLTILWYNPIPRVPIGAIMSFFVFHVEKYIWQI